MRKADSESSGRRRCATRRLIRLSGVVLGLGLLMVCGVARAQDDNEDEDKSFEQKIIDGIMRGMGATNMDNTGIDYRERSPLVVPRNLDLPPPESGTNSATNVPNWPKDPDEARRKAYAAQRKKEGRKAAEIESQEAARVLSPSELNARTAAPSGGTHASDSEKPGDAPAAPLSPSQLGFDGKLSNFFGGGKKLEEKEFKQEPPRESLTQPPPGYQTPSPNFAYGTGPMKPLNNNDYNPYAGKYGN